eukprot:GHVN01042084.1.p1 GENE.GHVN01042084.1~~GHVN01042084.1.p1  ORF type:complete len:144 (+),score=18.82 GHVN01042084.1:662-1093(+)
MWYCGCRLSCQIRSTFSILQFYLNESIATHESSHKRWPSQIPDITQHEASSKPSELIQLPLTLTGAGEVVNCSSVIRLEHVLSERNLHAVRLKSPISPNYEVRLTHPVPPILAVEFNSLLIVQRATQRPPHRVVLLFSPTTYR